MVWNDEFEYNGKPDTTKWDFNLGGHGWGNKEWQYYTNNITNAGVQDGRLIITASEEMYEDSILDDGHKHQRSRLASLW